MRGCQLYSRTSRVSRAEAPPGSSRVVTVLRVYLLVIAANILLLYRYNSKIQYILFSTVALFFSVYSSSGTRSCPQRLRKISGIFFLSMSIKTLYNILANRPNPATNAQKPKRLLPGPGVIAPTEHAAVSYGRLCNRVFRVSSFLSI